MTEFVIFPDLEKCGRLGNQLHQIAGTLGLARARGLRPLFPAEWSYRPYFSVPDEMFAPRDVLIRTSSVHAASLVPHLDPRTAIYLQDISLWSHVAEEVRELFVPSHLAATVALGNGNFLPREFGALHVRRGDNLVQQDFYPVAPLEWWLAAADLLVDRPLALVSDDMDWLATDLWPALAARGHAINIVRNGRPRLKEHEPGYWDGEPTDWIDLFRLTQCGAFVISNSSFGWWGAWLSRSDEVYYQWPFYGPRLAVENGGYCDASLMMPPEWKRLPL
jgi:hypothetical protein